MGRRTLESQESSDVVEFVTKGADSSPAVLARALAAQRAMLASELRRYGEDEVALKVEKLPAAKIASIHNRGMAIAFTGLHIPMSLCLAAVEEVEGKSRPLAGKRRKSAT